MLSHLSEHIADQRFVEVWDAVNELKQIHPATMFLHYNVEEVSTLVTVHQLAKQTPYNTSQCITCIATIISCKPSNTKHAIYMTFATR